MTGRFTRRAFVRTLPAVPAVAAGCGGHGTSKKEWTASFVGPSPDRGHLVRDGSAASAAVAETIRTEVVIVGAGVAGAAAVWHLARAGVRDLWVLELEDRTGGTAASETLPRSPHP
ncbi:MAG: hypothetical protein D6705_15040, partial [Deltaproteobacteria bacterium]